jgi:hypothetical protein
MANINEITKDEKKQVENEFDHCDFVSREHASASDPWAMGGYQPPQLKLPLPLSNLRHPEEMPSAEPASPVRSQASPAPPSPKAAELDTISDLSRRFLQQEASNLAAKLARDAIQAELNAHALRKRALVEAARTREAVQYSILDGVVWSIREALRVQGITVSCLEDVCDLQHKPIMSYIDFYLDSIGQTNFKTIIAKQFVDEFLKNNPKRVHMFTARTKLPPEGAVQAARFFEHEGLLLRGVGDYRIETDSHMIRLDCVYAISAEENLACLPTTQIRQAYLEPSIGADLTPNDSTTPERS